MSVFPKARLIRSTGWALASQGFSSLGNAFVSIVIAHSASSSALGSFGIAFATYTLTLISSRALASSRLAIETTQESGNAVLEAEFLAVAIAVSFAGAITLTAISFAMQGGRRDLMWIVALGMPLLIVQDYARGVAFSRGRAHEAASLDLAWLGTQLVFAGGQYFAGVTLTDRSLLGGWILGAGVSALFGLSQMAVRPRWLAALADFRKSWRRNLSLLVDFVTPAVGLQVLTYGLALNGGPGSVAPLRAAQTVMAPVNVVVMGLNPVMVIEARRSAASGAMKDLVGTQLRFGGLNACFLITVAALIHARGDTIGRLLVGGYWSTARPLIIPMAADLAGTALATAAIIVMRRLRFDGHILILRMVSLVLLVASALTFSSFGSVQVGITALAAVQWVVAATAWLLARHLMKRTHLGVDSLG